MAGRSAKEIVASLLTNWTDRSESDEQLLDELVRLGYSDFLSQAAEALQTYLESPEPLENKAEFVRDAAYRWFPPDNSDERALKWMSDLLPKIRAAARTSAPKGAIRPRK